MAASIASPQSSRRMFDGSELFPFLWRHFMSHAPLRQWLMLADSDPASTLNPTNISQGLAFCCNFTVPDTWSDFSHSFNLGEMFIPDHAVGQFMCGTVVASTNYHKHLICALGPAASRNPACMHSYRTTERRMVIDMGISRSINIMEFSWMQDGTLIVTCKILVPHNASVPFQSAGCTGTLALFTNVAPGGSLPNSPTSLISFVELPRCVFCMARGSPGCCCRQSMTTNSSLDIDLRSSSVWPPPIAQDITDDPVDAYHNIRSRLSLIRNISHVKITAHVVNTKRVEQSLEMTPCSYALGPSRFVVKPVLYRPSSSCEADTLRQVADKFRLLQASSLNFEQHQREQEPSAAEQNDKLQTTIPFDTNLKLDDGERFSVGITSRSLSIPGSGVTSDNANVVSVFSSETSRVSGRCGAGVTDVYKKVKSTKPVCVEKDKQLKQPKTLSTVACNDSVNDANEHGSNLTDTLSTNIVAAGRLQCPKCEKTFSQQGSLNRHLKNIHEDKKIPCEFCSMSFGQMFDLKVSAHIVLLALISVSRLCSNFCADVIIVYSVINGGNTRRNLRPIHVELGTMRSDCAW